MQERHLYEYAVIRVVPRVEREEFFNVGVVLYCKSQGFLAVKYEVNELKFQGFCTGMQLSDLREYLHTFGKIAHGGKDAGPIGRLPAAERFRWLTATRSTVIQTSKIHPGLTADPAKKLEQLFSELVI
ncbi:DUF3037 domain-containing protein [Leadbetterella sp. DM7]|uniref:DUF3037 domain-containing protein n=1 Tax=Leadbetterella sp. DM7 TaxID=3235085 RepID=UPI00349ECF99